MMRISPRITSGLLWFNGLSALYGGGYLLGGAAGMDEALLEGTPFVDFVWPGVILLVIVGGTSLIAAAARNRQHPSASLTTIVAGLTLLIWLIVEFIWIPEYWPAQVAYFVVAIGILAGGWAERRGIR